MNRFRTLSFSLLVLVLLAAAWPAAAQATSISIGEPVEVDLSSGNISLTLEVENPLFADIAVIAKDGQTDSYLTLSNPLANQTLYIDNNDGSLVDASPNDPTLANVPLMPGSYALDISGFGGSGELEVRVVPTTGLFAGGTAEAFRDEVAAGGRRRETLEFKRDEVVGVIVSTTTADFDPRLEVRDEDGVLIAENDSHAFGYNTPLSYADAALLPLVIPADGEYDLEVSSWNDAVGGAFVMAVFRFGAITPSDSNPQLITGEIVINGRRWLPLEVGAGEVLRITVTAPDDNLDPRVTLYDADGIEIARNDDHGTPDPALRSLDAQISNVITSKAGNYTIEVSQLSGAGRFEVIIQRLGTFVPAGGE